MDFAVQGSSQNFIQSIIDETHMGEMEFGSNYTHIGLPTFSKSYLQRNGIYSDKIYRKLNAENVELSLYAKQKIIKRMDASNWSPRPSHFDVKKNLDTFWVDSYKRQDGTNVSGYYRSV